MNSLAWYLIRQRGFSERTFGAGLRTKGICAHIRKELTEIEAEPADLDEWIDVIILAIDGFWRAGGQPNELFERLRAKQTINFARKWPAPLPEDQPVEHIR